MSYDTKGSPNNGAARYRAYCPTCKQYGREFTRYSSAEQVAQGHADDRNHTTCVVDHYGMKVVNSTRQPMPDAQKGAPQDDR